MAEAEVRTVSSRRGSRYEHTASICQAIREGRWTAHTAGIAPHLVQGNVVILPVGYAVDFMRYCQRNPKPCPLLAVSEPGDPTLSGLGRDIDIRYDVPRYRVFRNGVCLGDQVDIARLWRYDLVTFVLGCSFSFEYALLRAKIPVRHLETRSNVPMYRTNLETEPAGPFRGPLVVSMRPLSAKDAIRAVQITSHYPTMHGAPVHLGNPRALGIMNLYRPDFGDCVAVLPEESPVFWACGVTSQFAIAQARPDICITHSPGAMLITALENEALASA